MNPTRETTIETLQNHGIIAVVRAPDPETVPSLIRALLSGGVHTVEITLTTPNALEVIRRAGREHGDAVLLGVGSVLDSATALAAMDAGARFVVSPIVRPELVSTCHARACPVMLGAYSPTEAQLAHESGADFVKLFPADSLGPAYIKALLAPLPHLRLVPTGGVTAENTASFIRAGCSAVGAGSSLIPTHALRERRWELITQRAQSFVQGVWDGRSSS